MEIERLCFISVKDNVRCFWDVESSGIWDKDNRVGRQHAEDCISYMRDHEAPNLLGSIVRAMTKVSEFSGIEVGFLHGIAVHSMT